MLYIPWSKDLFFSHAPVKMQIFQKGKNSNDEESPFIKFIFSARWEEIEYMKVNIKFREIYYKCVIPVGAGLTILDSRYFSD